MNGRERRRHIRIDSLNLLACEILDEQGNRVSGGMGRTLNISESGILLESHFCLDPDTLVELTIALEERLITLPGKVVHCGSDGEGMFRNGIEFMKVQGENLEILREFIQIFRQQDKQ